MAQTRSLSTLCSLVAWREMPLGPLHAVDKLDLAHAAVGLNSEITVNWVLRLTLTAADQHAGCHLDVEISRRKGRVDHHFGYPHMIHQGDTRFVSQRECPTRRQPMARPLLVLDAQLLRGDRIVELKHSHQRAFSRNVYPILFERSDRGLRGAGTQYDARAAVVD